MKVRRKFSLSRIGHQYESLDIELEGDSIEDIMNRIDQAWNAYAQGVVNGKVQ